MLRLLRELSGGTVVSLDNMNDYYDPKLKEYRLGLIEKAAEESPVKHVFIKGSTLGSDPFEEMLKILQKINMRTDLTRRMD